MSVAIMDANNSTGYAQILEETINGGASLTSPGKGEISDFLIFLDVFVVASCLLMARGVGFLASIAL